MSAVSQPPVGCRASCNLFFISMGNKVGDGLALSDFVRQWAEVGLDLNDFFVKTQLLEEVAGDEMDEAYLVHKEANAVWPPHITKYTGYEVPFRVVVLQQEAYQGCSFVMGLFLFLSDNTTKGVQ